MKGYGLVEERITREGDFVKVSQTYFCSGKGEGVALFTLLKQRASRFWATVHNKQVSHTENEVFYGK